MTCIYCGSKTEGKHSPKCVVYLEDKIREAVSRAVITANEATAKHWKALLEQADKCTEASVHKAYNEGLEQSVKCSECDAALRPIERMGGSSWSHGDFQCAAEMQKEHAEQLEEERRYQEIVSRDEVQRAYEDAAKIIEGFTILDPIGAAVAIRARAEETK